MKNIIVSIICCLMIMVGMIGCGDNGGNNPVSPTQEEEDTCLKPIAYPDGTRGCADEGGTPVIIPGEPRKCGR